MKVVTILNNIVSTYSDATIVFWRSEVLRVQVGYSTLKYNGPFFIYHTNDNILAGDWM